MGRLFKRPYMGRKRRPPLPYLNPDMGVVQFLEALEPHLNSTTLEDIQGKNLAIDAYSLLYKAADVTRSYRSIAIGFQTHEHIDYCVDLARLLLIHAKTLTFVFHGRTLPMLESFERRLNSARHENMKIAVTDDLSFGEGVGDVLCMKYYRKAFSISPEVAHHLFKALSALDSDRVKSIVAPYDANAQLAFLVKMKAVDVVITDDPCLILFGCGNIIFKMDKDGRGLKFEISEPFKLEYCDTEFDGFNLEQLQTACLLSGCSYAPSCGVNFHVACSLCKKLGTFYEVIEARVRKMDYRLREATLKHFERAMWVFRCQKVYDPYEKKLIFLSDLLTIVPKYFDAAHLKFLGPPFPKECSVTEVAEGIVHPIDLQPFKDYKNDVPQTAEQRFRIFFNKRAELFPTEEEEERFVFYWCENCYYSSDDCSIQDSEDESMDESDDKDMEVAKAE